MNVTTEVEEFPPFASLAISPDLQALLEFDDRIRAAVADGQKRSEAVSPGRAQHAWYPPWKEQEVPTISLPPPRRKRKKSVPASPKTISELEGVSPVANASIGVGDSGVAEEVVLTRPEDIPEENENVQDVMNPYLNSPPSPPRYFYPRSDDDEGGGQPSGFYTLERSRAVGRTKRQRSLSDRSQGGQLLPPRALGRTTGSRPKERVSGPRAAATRPLLLHRHKASLSSAHSHQTGTSYEPSSSPEPRVSISSTIYSASSSRSLPIPSSYDPSPVQGSFIDLGSPPMSPSEIAPPEPMITKPTSVTDSPRPTYPHSRPESPLPKPPIPTTPKPVFNRPRSLRRSIDGKSPKFEELPPTTTMTSAERAGLVKKTRKITQLFGQTPGPELVSLSSPMVSPLQRSLLSDTRKGHRAIASISNPIHPSDKGVWPPPDETLYLNINGRRHSTPLSPTNTSTLWGLDEDDSVLDIDRRSSFTRKPSRNRSSKSSPISPAPSPVSFIDLSEDDSATETPKEITDYKRQAPFSRETMLDDTASLRTLTSSQFHETERRRKREKLVKLHRFLGSRVPTELILGLDIPKSPELPPPASPDMGPEDTRKKFRMRRRRSSSWTEYTKPLTAREDRVKADLGVQEKALNVRRAAKMEKVFGVAPPQTLYHTRPSSPAPAQARSVDPEASPVLTPIESFPCFVIQGFGYKGKKSRRSATPDSFQALISRSDTSNSIEIYNSYHDSLNSLIEIVDNDDKLSLKAIHDILHEDDDDGDDGTKRRVDDDDYDSSEPDVPSPVTIRDQRRRSLPLCPSISSMHSEYSITSPPPEISTFEQKRRRAAKLTNFFGVSHRDIMDGILESIESGVAEERGMGTLNQAQADDLLQKVWNLKTRT